MSKRDEITILGAGLCGSLLALRLGQLNYSVNVIEKREDPRKVKDSEGRSINLALSNRGLKGLNLVDLKDKVKEIVIPMNGRMIHDIEGNTYFSKYSGRNESINSISRKLLNELLISEAEKLDNVKFHFNTPCQKINLDSNYIELIDNEKVDFKYLISADGGGSILRKELEKLELFKSEKIKLGHSYKELNITASKQNEFKIDPDALHIWPRGEFMLIALPNLDKSFTVTLFLAKEEGKENFGKIKTDEEISSFFNKYFIDAKDIIENLIENFKNNPTSSLSTIKCTPWHYKNCLLIGDAAHAIVPFYGQGMNACFEDVVFFDELLDKNDFNILNTFEQFSKERKINTDAIADLALDNYYEMRDHVAQEDFIIKRKIETKLEQELPKKYYSKYSLVTFNESISYSEAMNKGRIQDNVILKLISEKKLNENLSAEEILSKIEKEIKHYNEPKSC